MIPEEGDDNQNEDDASQQAQNVQNGDDSEEAVVVEQVDYQPQEDQYRNETGQAQAQYNEHAGVGEQSQMANQRINNPPVNQDHLDQEAN